MTDDTTDRRGPARPSGLRLRRPAALLGAAALVAAAATAVTVGSAAQAADTPKTALGKNGQKLTVSASANLNPDGETLKVTGEGYDETKGIYVALCKDNGDDRIPTPCLGGADQTGDSGASKWIVPKDDPNEGDLTETFGEGGTFDVDITVKSKDTGLDCTQVTCSVVTRVDHRAAGDRSQDVRIPVTFEGQDPGDGGGDGDGVDLPAGTVSYVKSASYNNVGQPQDTLLHPESGKLYVGSSNIPDTSDVNEAGLYALDPKDGKLLSHVAQAPSSTGVLGPRNIQRIVAPLAGDGVVFQYPVRGIGTAKDGDTAAKGVWPAGGSITGVGPGTDAGTVLISQGAVLSKVEIATGTVKDSVTLDGGAEFGVDTTRGVIWSADAAAGKLRRIDAASLDVTATVDLPTDLLAFVEVDVETGNVWVGSGYSALVYDKDGKSLATLKGTDRPMAVTFDKTTKEAFVLRGDYGNADDGADNVGALDVYDSATFEQAAQTLALPGTRFTSLAGIAVLPGAGSVYATNPAESLIIKLDRRMTPKVTQSPTDRSVAPGTEVSLVAAAEALPEPTVKWQVSADGGQTWTDIEGATKNAYTFTAKAAHDGYEYRAEFKNSVGTTRTSPITLTVTEADSSTGGGDGGGDGDADDEPSGTKTVTGSEGQKLTVTPVNNLATENQTLKITGSGYDEEKGIYVALCVDNGDGELPTPCIGGVDMTGESHSSAWISSNPPDYGEELATPYEEGGKFEVELTVDAKDEFTDCFKATCVLATRADHTLSGDRSQDVKVPVAFVGQDPVDTDDEGDGDDGGSSSGGTTSGSTSTGGSSSTGGSGSTGGGTTTGDGGSLASTGMTVLGVAASAAALTVTGWILHRRARGTGGDTAS
ncbi:immunoglobulin domain-containing protein [Streptomyces tailanensis]|uniref:immunoglobulin domain-containing protein n=1 Tax=Streptomyces tailanensis TaxID=2569858 RepID=UPI00122E9A21|nr:immunoglobulin domain-containing protein [Streptomyces tailanensis]